MDAAVAAKQYLFYCGSLERKGQFPVSLRYSSSTCVTKCPTSDTEEVLCLMKDVVNFSRPSEKTGYVRTLQVGVTQTLTTQKAYPTELYRGRFCIPPPRGDTTIREETIHGPLQHHDRLERALASLKHAWPVLLGAAGITVFLGWLYLLVLKRFAGLLIFAALCIATVLLAVMGFFFLWAIFVNPDYDNGAYQQLNPIIRSFVGVEAKGISVLLGLILISLSVCLAFTTYTSLPKIDESIGLVQAAVDCIFDSPKLCPCKCCSCFNPLQMVPLGKALALIIISVALLIGLMLVMSFGYVDKDYIYMDGQVYQGLRGSFQWHWWWRICIMLYIFGCFWIVFFVEALSTYAVSYAVSTWYFQPRNETRDENPLFLGNGPTFEVMINGVDGVGERQANIQHQSGGRVIVAGLGVPGPGGRDRVPEAKVYDNKGMPITACTQGVVTGLCFHTGSLALGCWLVVLTAPIRLLGMCIKTFVGRSDRPKYSEELDVAALIKMGFSIVASFIDAMVGFYSKNAYCEIVLSANPWSEATMESYEFILKAGGVVAFLHGSLGIYEVISVLMLTAIGSGLTVLALTQWSLFADPANVATYVQDPWMMTLLSALICGIIAYGYMSLFNVTADTLLYTFAWGRVHDKEINGKVLPVAMRNLLGVEKDSVPDDFLRPKAGALHHFKHVFHGYRENVMETMTRREQSPLLTQTGNGGMMTQY